MKTLLRTTLLALICTIPLFSQESEISGGATEEQKLEQLFNQMMLTFPGAVKAKIDSASERPSEFRQTQGDQKQHGSEVVREMQQGMINELSEELRLQVEKTISEIEEKRNERSLQFREYKRSQTGSR